MSKAYVAVIADAVRSRSLLPGRRARLQAALRTALGDLNRRYHRDLAARFGITQGDELQCLLVSTARLWEVAHVIRHRFADVDWVIGVGRGAITTDLAGGKINAPEVDGPCFHEARAAVEAAKRERLLFAFRGFGAAEARLNGLAGYYSALYWSWTTRQRGAATAWRAAAGPDAAATPAAGRTVVPSAVSHLRRRMAWPLVEQGDKMLRALLEADTA